MVGDFLFTSVVLKYVSLELATDGSYAQGCTLLHSWSHRLTVRTPGFHPGNRSSILREITIAHQKYFLETHAEYEKSPASPGFLYFEGELCRV